MGRCYLVYVITVCFVLAGACRNVPKNAEEGPLPVQHVQGDTVLVKTEAAIYRPFSREVYATGKLAAVRKAVVPFRLNEMLAEVLVKNGDYVEAGQVLAKHDHVNLKNRCERAREFYEKALIDLDDRLIDLGYRLKDSATLPPTVYKMARIKSGFNSALFDYQAALQEFSLATIKAPFAGLIANLEAAADNMPEGYRKLCTVLDDRKLNVDFFILESERQLVKKGATVIVTAYDDSTLTERAVVTNINPVIDENGMVKVGAVMTNQGHRFIDGMSVRVIASSTAGNQLMVPVTAVLARQEREVVFTYVNGRAIWNYVQSGERNSRYVVILSGLEKGAEVIVAGNQELVHDANVKLRR